MSFKHPLIPPFLNRFWWDIWDYPAVLWDQHFGMVLSDDDLHRPVLNQVRSPTRAAIRSSGKSEVTNSKDKFLVELNICHFKSKGIQVKVCDNHVVIDATHDKQPDEHGTIERKFSRRYVLPEECDYKAVRCILNTRAGILTIEAPKNSEVPPSAERAIVIAEVEADDDKE